MNINKVESMWLSAAVNTYEICKTKPDWELSDIYFKQSKLITDANNILEDKTTGAYSAIVSGQSCAYTSYTTHNHLVANDKLRRISYSSEFDGDRERPGLGNNMTIDSTHGEINFEELTVFIDEKFSPAIKQKLNNKYEKYDIDLIIKYLKDYSRKKYIDPKKAGQRRDEMIEHSARGREAREMLVDISAEIQSFMPKYLKADVSGWLNQGQNVEEYIWSQLRKRGKDKFPSSMSISVGKNEGQFQLRVGVEIQDSKCTEPEDYVRHNRLLDKENTNSELKYWVVDSQTNKLVVSPLSREELKNEIAHGKYQKVQLCKVMRQDEIIKKSGKEIIEFIVKAMNELEPFYDLTVKGDSGESTYNEGGNNQMNVGGKLDYKKTFDNNMILYGPPGTGKTYNTVLYALAICENVSMESLQKEPYTEVLERFNQLKDKGQISFTTFHQSYGYEEFIEGIKPVISKDEDLDDGDIKYEYSEGIFKKFCRKAGEVKVKASSIDIDESPNVWHVLLDGTEKSKLKDDCFNNNYIKIGWRNKDEIITKQSPNLNNQIKSILLNFQDDMEIGDIVLTQKNNKSIDGIGVITSDYRFVEGGRFPRTRDVRWIKTGIDENVISINENTRLDRKTIYPLSRMNIRDVMKLIEKYTSTGDVSINKNDKPYVFIIDEINRGNISKIFGELITLIEDTKRVGADEEMKVKLPYTGDEFGVPTNVYLVGTMNTADRSIALIDTALRRRFKFIEMLPDSNVLKNISADKIISEDGLKELDVALMLDTINQRIECLFDREHTIGHAFFTGLKENPTIEILAEIFSKSVIPLLQEYFYEDYSKIQLVLGDNDKTEDKFKFILNSNMKTKDVFKGNPDFDFPETKYTIQEEAFSQIESYLQINK